MNKEKRHQRLFPNGIPRYVRCYDNLKNNVFDRYTVIFSGNYVGRDGYCHYLGMSANPFHPQGFGQHGESRTVIDRPSYRHLGKKIKFTDLPTDCQKLVMNDYCALWGY